MVLLRPCIDITGNLGENFDFPNLENQIRSHPSSGRGITLDFSRLGRVNSIGIRSFCLIMSKFQIPIFFENCPVFLIEHLNLSGPAFFWPIRHR